MAKNLDEVIENWINTKTAVYDFVADDNIQHNFVAIRIIDIIKKLLQF